MSRQRKKFTKKEAELRVKKQKEYLAKYRKTDKFKMRHREYMRDYRNRIREALGGK